ncbi:MAG: hypothetical protein GX489_08655 [Firmicutes bacterium]|jgi:hypothetical protein|nr:hypothetical protein [Bacillota bacterium]
MITLDNYLNVITQRLAPYYDVFQDEMVAGEKWDLLARFKMRSEKYFFLKEIKLFAYENHEIVLVRGIDQVTAQTAEHFAACLKKVVADLVQPSDEHMSTVLTGILVATGGITPQGRQTIERFRYSRNFSFLLRGWCDVRLLAVDLTAHEVYSNKAGRAVREAYCIAEGKEGQVGTSSASVSSVSG